MGEFTPYFDARATDEPPVIGIEKHDTPQPRSTYVDFALGDDAAGWIVISEEGVRSVAFGRVDVTDQELGQYLRHAVTAWHAAYQDLETAPGLQFELDTSPLASRPTLTGIERRDDRRTRFTFRGGSDEYAVVVSPSGVEPGNGPPSVVRHAVTAWRVLDREFATSL